MNAQRRPSAVGPLLLLVVIALAGCASTSDDPAPRSVAELVTDAARFDGQPVIVEGHVRTHDDPRHHWLEDASGNRIGLNPDDAIADHVGSRVRVTGTFATPDPDAGLGRRIEIHDVEVLEPRTDAAPAPGHEAIRL